MKGVPMKLSSVLGILWNVMLFIAACVCMYKSNTYAESNEYPKACYYLIWGFGLAIFNLHNGLISKLDVIEARQEVKE
jgi:hypothetical protein